MIEPMPASESERHKSEQQPIANKQYMNKSWTMPGEIEVQTRQLRSQGTKANAGKGSNKVTQVNKQRPAPKGGKKGVGAGAATIAKPPSKRARLAAKTTEKGGEENSLCSNASKDDAPEEEVDNDQDEEEDGDEDLITPRDCQRQSPAKPEPGHRGFHPGHIQPPSRCDDTEAARGGQPIETGEGGCQSPAPRGPRAAAT